LVFQIKSPLTSVLRCEFCDGGFDAFAEFGGGEDFGVDAPTEYPTFNFRERAEFHRELDASGGEVGECLGIMPDAFADAVGDLGGETDFDLVIAAAAEHSEGIGEKLLR